MERPTISEAFEIYRLEYIVYRNQSDRTEEMSSNAMKQLISFVGDIAIQDLTFDMVRKWKEHLEKTKSQNTVRGYIIKLRVVLKHLSIKGYTNILNAEMVGVPKRAEVVVDFIRPEEVNKLIDAVSMGVAGYTLMQRYKNRAIISLLYASGIRVSELCSLNRSSFMNTDMSFTVIGKGNKARLCFYDSRTKYFIDEYLLQRTDKIPALFINQKTGARINKGMVELMFVNATKKAGFDRPIHPHTMRHSFATNLLRNNTNPMYVRDFLGHKSVQTTEMYMHVVNEDLRAIYTEKHTV